jgi:hypothetical protein
LLNYLSISLCRLNACGENIMLFGNTRIFVPEDSAGKVRGLSPVDRGRCCGRGSEKMRRHIYPNRLKGYFEINIPKFFVVNCNPVLGEIHSALVGIPDFIRTGRDWFR